jgi:hypothetical protein
MLRMLVKRLLGRYGGMNGTLWDHRPLLQTAPPPPRLGRATQVGYLRVLDGGGASHRALTSLPDQSQRVASHTEQAPGWRSGGAQRDRAQARVADPA